MITSAAGAQRLWSVERVAARPAAPDRFPAALALPSAAAGAEALARVASVQVEYDFLRLGMGYLELPLADGSTMEAENAVFEDRGEGNVMWAGEVPGTGYESVLFTLQDEHLVGWFGEPGGPKYVVYAGPDGKGTVTVEQGPTGDWCGVVDADRSAALKAVATPARDRPEAAVRNSTINRLDILVLYPGETERYWRVIGGPAVGVQQYSDFLNMVFRNGRIPATANLIAVRWDPKAASNPLVNGYHYAGVHSDTWHFEYVKSAEVYRLRALHMPDLLYFLPASTAGLVSQRGGAALGRGALRGDLEPSVLAGWNIVDYLAAFPHEIGHMLGAIHEPAEYPNLVAGIQRESFRPHIFGHTDMTSCAKREDSGDLLVCPRTAMSYQPVVKVDQAG